MNAPLQFGTDGWRAVIGDAFTFHNLARISQATADVLVDATNPRIVIGHDRRFMAAAHADRVGEVFAASGFHVLRVNDALPTPALSGLVVDHEASAGIMLTASHNPPTFGGFKIKLHYGGSASSEFTSRVEAHLDTRPIRSVAIEQARRRGLWEDIDFESAYRQRLATRIDSAAIAAAKPLSIVVDSMHGCGARLIEEFLRDTPHQVVTLRTERDVMFGGAGPEPVEDRLQGLVQAVRETHADLGLATDGDADRLAAVNETGQFLSALHISPLLAAYLIDTRGEPGDLAKTTANTVLMDRIAAAHHRNMHVRPIGFKHLVPLLRSGTVLVGGEESGGLGVAGYLPERDGVLMALLLIEARVCGDRPLSHLLTDLQERYGEFHYRRRDLAVSPERAASAVAVLAASPPAQIAGLAVSSVDTMDGTKLVLGDAGWIMVRRSGTEPVLRIYCEARSPAEVETLLDAMECLAID